MVHNRKPRGWRNYRRKVEGGARKTSQAQMVEGVDIGRVKSCRPHLVPHFSVVGTERSENVHEFGLAKLWEAPQQCGALMAEDVGRASPERRRRDSRKGMLRAARGIGLQKARGHVSTGHNSDQGTCSRLPI